MPEEPVSGPERVRTAELVAAMCLATDLAMGFPFEHGLNATRVAMRLGDRLGIDAETGSETYYACLLTYCGCTADAEMAAEIFGGSTRTHLIPVLYGSQRQMFAGIVRSLPPPARPAPVRVLEVARRLPRAAKGNKPHQRALCEVGEMLAGRLGLPAPVQSLFAYHTERWDGKGQLRRAKRGEIPLALRIAHVAGDAAFQDMLGGLEHAARVVQERAGGAFDPEIAACLVDNAAEILAPEDRPSAWEQALDDEPPPRLVLEADEIDRALAAMGDFADLISPYFAGHAAGVSKLAEAAATHCRLPAAERVAIRRAALVHDLGRVAIETRIWQKPQSLTADDWEQVRLHPYHTERVLSRSSFLSALAPIASAHHERLDGSGYHRGASAAALTLPARLLASADAYHAMTEPRPHREALPPERAAEVLGEEAHAGRLDAEAVAAGAQGGGTTGPGHRASGRIDRTRG